MRIVGGRLGGRTLAGPKSQAIRPTSDRLRESLFNILAHSHGDPVTGARVLDLFAGTGALGLEAMSRGAQSLFAPSTISIWLRSASLDAAGWSGSKKPKNVQDVSPLGSSVTAFDCRAAHAVSY